jgi:hypothetical protein
MATNVKKDVEQPYSETKKQVILLCLAYANV